MKGVGPRRAADLARAGLHTVEDLLYRFPLRYEDRSRFAAIASLKPGQAASIAGRILSCGLRSTRRPGFKIFEAAVQDAGGPLRVSWLNQPFLRDVFARGQHVVLFGLVEMRGHGGLQLTNPQYEILDDEDAETIHTGRDRAGLREGRQRHAEDAAAPRPRRPAAPAGRPARRPARVAAPPPEAAGAARGADSARTFRPPDVPVDAAEPLRHAGAARG